MNDATRNRINEVIMQIDQLIKSIESMFSDRHHTHIRAWQEAVQARDMLLRILEDNKEVIK